VLHHRVAISFAAETLSQSVSEGESADQAPAVLEEPLPVSIAGFGLLALSASGLLELLLRRMPGILVRPELGGEREGIFPLAAPVDYVDLVSQDGACSESVGFWVQSQIEMEE